MKDEEITKEQLASELLALRQRVAELEASEDDHGQAEEELQECDGRFRYLAENVDIGITMIDSYHNIIWANPAVGKWFDKSPNELVGKKCYAEFEKKNKPCSHCPGIKAMATGQAHEVETQGIRDDGTQFTVRDRAFPLLGKDGEIIGFHEIIEDITEHKQVEKALVRSEEQFRTLVSNIPGVVYRCACDDAWTVNFISDNVEVVFGYPSSDFIDNRVRTFESVIHRDDTQMVRKIILDAIERKGLYDIDYRIVRADGSIRWVYEKGRGVYSDDGQVSYLDGAIFDNTERKQVEVELITHRENLENIVTDRTAKLKVSNEKLIQEAKERKQADKAMRDSEERYRTLTSNIPGAVYRCACDDAWSMKFVSDYMEVISGYPPSDFINNRVRTFESIIYCDDSQIAGQTAFDAMKRKEPYEIEYRIINADGMIRWVYEKGRGVYSDNDQIVYLDGVIFDITERKQVEKDLQESEKRFRSVTESSLDSIHITDINGNIVYWNNAAVNLFGYDENEVLGKSDTLLMPDWVKSIEARARQKYFETGISNFNGKSFESAVLKKDGSEFPVEITISKWEMNGQSFFTTIARDITERKLAEEQIKASLAEKEVLLKEVHHRVKNNLSIVSGLMSLQAAGMDSPESCEALAECRDRINAIALVHNTLYRSDNLAKIDYSVYAQDLSRAVLDVCGRGGQVKLDIAVESVFLEIDKAVNCGLILNELLTNAFKHAFPNGSEGSIRVVFAMRDDGHFSLCVSDNGVGLPVDVDFQNPETLGLKLVNMLTRQLKGSLDIDRQNTGTAITIIF